MLTGSDFPLIKKLISKWGGKVNPTQINDAIDSKVADGTLASGEQLEKKANLKTTYIPNDCVAFWDFSEDKPPFIDKIFGHKLLVGNGMPSSIKEKPFGGGIRLSSGTYLKILSDDISNLNISKFGDEVTVVAWINRKHTGNSFICGMWQEDDNSPKRQYGLFSSLPSMYGGEERVIGHISRYGGASPNIPYSRDYSATGRVIPQNTPCFVGFTYDGNYIKSYMDGVTDTYINFTEAGLPVGEGLTYSKNPYTFNLGLNRDTVADFTVGAVKLTSGMGNFYIGDILGIMIFNRSLTDAEMGKLNYVNSINNRLLTIPQPKLSTSSDFVYKHGFNVYSNYSNVKCELNNSTNMNSGFAITRFNDNTFFYVSPSYNNTMSMVELIGLNVKPSQIKKITFDMNNKGASNNTVRVCFKIKDKWYVSNDRFSSVGGNTSGGDWSTKEIKEYTISCNKNKWNILNVDVSNTLSIGDSLINDLPNYNIDSIGFLADNVPNVVDSSSVLRFNNVNIFK